MIRLAAAVVFLLVSLASFGATRVFYDGFEDNTTNKWDQYPGRPKCPVVTSAADGGQGPTSGTYMLRCNWDGSDQSFEVLFLPVSEWPYTSEFFVRWQFRTDDNKDLAYVSSGAKTFRFSYVAGDPIDEIYSELIGTGSLHIVFAPNQSIENNTWIEAPVGDTNWHLFEMYIKHDTNNTDGRYKVWIDDVLKIDFTGNTNTPGDNWGPFFLMSNWSDAHDATNYAYWDDIEFFSDNSGGEAATGSMLNGDITLDTGGGDTTAPTVTNPQPTGNLSSGTTNVDISVDATDAGTVTGCKYHASDVAYASMSGTLTFDTGSTWKTNITGLSDGNFYTYYARCIDDSGNANLSSTIITFSVALVVPPSLSITASPPAKTILTTPPLRFTITDADGTGSTTYNLTWGGDCSGPASVVGTGIKQVSLNTLSIATHSNCTLMVTDPEDNDSSVENIASFEIVSAQTFFGQTVPTTNVNEGAPGSEFGLYFKTDTNGDLLGVRFWRLPSSGEVPHTVQLWDPSGTPTSLVTKTSASEPFNGQWVDVFFDTPYSIVAGIPYLVSFHTPGGQYGLQDGALLSPLTVGNLYSYGNPDTEGALNTSNGAYFDGTTQFPSNHSGFGNGFGVDVLFVPGGGGSGPVAENECASPGGDWVFCEDFESTSWRTDSRPGWASQLPNTKNWTDTTLSNIPDVADNGPANSGTNTAVEVMGVNGSGGTGNNLWTDIDNASAGPQRLYGRWYMKFINRDFTDQNHNGGLIAGDNNLTGASDFLPPGDNTGFAQFWTEAWNSGAGQGKWYTYAYTRGMYQEIPCRGATPGSVSGCYGDSYPCIYDTGGTYCITDWHKPVGGIATLPSATNDDWICVEQMVDVGTPSTDGSVRDGMLKVWINGILTTDINDLWIRTNSNFGGVNELYLQQYFHNSGHANDSGYYLDNVVLSTSRIGCGTDTPDITDPVLSSAGPTGTISSPASLAVTSDTNCDAVYATDRRPYAYATAQTAFTTTGGTSHSDSVALSNGDYTYYYQCEDASGNLSDPIAVFFTISAGDVIPPVVSGCGPSGVQVWNIGTVNLACTTDEAATCKYGNVKNTAYASITNTFTTTGSTSHSQSLAAEEGRVYHQYVRCIDAFGNANTSDTGVHYTISSRPRGRVHH